MTKVTQSEKSNSNEAGGKKKQEKIRGVKKGNQSMAKMWEEINKERSEGFIAIVDELIKDKLIEKKDRMKAIDLGERMIYLPKRPRKRNREIRKVSLLASVQSNSLLRYLVNNGTLKCSKYDQKIGAEVEVKRTKKELIVAYLKDDSCLDLVDEE